MGSDRVLLIGSSSEWKKRVLEKGTRHPRVVVDFFASWCPPCRMIAPVYDNLAKTYTNVKFIKIDVDEAKGVAARCGIQQMPTFQFYLDGEMVNTLLGADKSKLEALIKDLSQSDSTEPEPVEDGSDEDGKGVKAFFKKIFSR